MNTQIISFKKRQDDQKQIKADLRQTFDDLDEAITDRRLMQNYIDRLSSNLEQADKDLERLEESVRQLTARARMLRLSII